MRDNCVRCEAVFVGHSLIFCRTNGAVSPGSHGKLILLILLLSLLISNGPERLSDIPIQPRNTLKN